MTAKEYAITLVILGQKKKKRRVKRLLKRIAKRFIEDFYTTAALRGLSTRNYWFRENPDKEKLLKLLKEINHKYNMFAQKVNKYAKNNFLANNALVLGLRSLDSRLYKLLN